MKLPAAEPRNTAAPAISSGMPMRSSGERAVEAFSVSGLSHNALAKSVLIRPGAMQLTRTLCGPYSQARLRASCMSAALEMQYAPIVVDPLMPPIDDTMITEPSLRAIMSGTTMLVSQLLATMLLLRILLNWSSEMSASGP